MVETSCNRALGNAGNGTATLSVALAVALAVDGAAHAPTPDQMTPPSRPPTRHNDLKPPEQSRPNLTIHCNAQPVQVLLISAADIADAIIS
jgi:hypothetical protein